MSLLAPLFLLGGLAIALPVVFHLIRRTTRERTRFSSLMFLQSSPPRLTRRNRLEHWLLLLLRATVLALLAFGFARPFLKELLPGTPATGEMRRQVVLLDTSASMRREGLWPAAIRKAEDLVRQAGPADQLALYTFDRQSRPILTFEEWSTIPVGERLAQVRVRLAGMGPGWASTALDTALLQASELLADAGDPRDFARRQVILITDFQEGSQLTALQGREWPKDIEVISEMLPARGAGNAGLAWLPETTDAPRAAEAAIRLRLSNAANSKREQFQVGWAAADGVGFIGKPLETQVAPGQSRVISLPVLAGTEAGSRVLLRGDDEPFDNTTFVNPPRQARMTILYFGSEMEADPRQPLYFLRRAFPETPRQSIQILAQRSGTLPATAVGDAASLFVITDAPDQAEAAFVGRMLDAGKTILCAPKNAAAGAALARVVSLERLGSKESERGGYALLGEVDFRHPLFAPFADPRFSDFTKIHFWKRRELDLSAVPQARVIARFDDGTPAIAEVPAGKGRVVLLASGWHPEDSQLALSSKFVPLLHALLEFAGAGLAPATALLVGDPITLPPQTVNSPSERSILKPDGTTEAIRRGEMQFASTQSPGIYVVGSGLEAQYFAVNVDPSESRTAPLPADELERLGVPGPRASLTPVREEARQVRLLNSELEGRQKLWRWFILAALVLLLLETWLAGRTARRNVLRLEASA